VSRSSACALVAHNGGAATVINTSPRGMVEAARRCPETATVYGAQSGIKAVSEEDLLEAR